MKIFLNAYLAENFGDDLFVEVIAQRYPHNQFEVLTTKEYKANFSSNVKPVLTERLQRKLKLEEYIVKTLWRFHLPNRYFFPKFLRASVKIRNCLAKASDINIYVIGSGFMENIKYNFMDYFVDLPYYTHKLNLIGCNFGPYKSDSYLTYHKKLFKRTNDICFRDKASYNLFNNKNYRHEKDVVFNYKGEKSSPLSSDFGDYVLISVVNPFKDQKIKNNGKVKIYLDFLESCIDYIIQKGQKVVLVGFCREEADDEMIESLLSKVSYKDEIVVFNYPDITFEKMMGLFAEADSVIASRYHAMIISMLYQRPTYTIAYSKKTVNVLKDIDVSIPFVSTDELQTISPKQFLDDFGYCISDSLLSKIKSSAERQFEKLDNLLL